MVVMSCSLEKYTCISEILAAFTTRVHKGR